MMSNICPRRPDVSESLDDGEAIMGHDAVLTAVRAIRLTRANSPEADAVIQQLSQIKETKAVLGASGCISLDLDGNPANKVIPILELKPDGSVTFVQFAPHHPLAVW